MKNTLNMQSRAHSTSYSNISLNFSILTHPFIWMYNLEENNRYTAVAEINIIQMQLLLEIKVPCSVNTISCRKPV